MQEIWKPIVGYEGYYEISNLWRVKSFKYWTERIIKLSKIPSWYIQISLYSNWLAKHYFVHRLVAIHFIPNPNNLPLVCHKDETLDERWMLYNWAGNLFWGTQKDNMQDCYKKWRWNNHLQLNNPHKWKFWKYSFKSKKVNQYSMDWKFIKEWWSVIDAKKVLWQIHISECCHWKQKSAWWYIWKYKNK